MSKQNLFSLCIWQGRVKRAKRKWSTEKRAKRMACMMVGFSMGKGSYFPPWESFFLSIRSNEKHNLIMVYQHLIILFPLSSTPILSPVSSIPQSLINNIKHKIKSI